MITSETKQKIEHYLEIIEKSSSPDPRQPSKTLADMGLIIFEPDSEVIAANIQDIISPEKAIIYRMNNPYDYETFLSKLIEANNNNQWLIVDCQDDFNATTVGIIKQISEMNKFTVLHFGDKDNFQLEIKPETRIIFCLQSDFLENKVTYPYFLNIFNSILRI